MIMVISVMVMILKEFMKVLMVLSIVSVVVVENSVNDMSVSGIVMVSVVWIWV